MAERTPKYLQLAESMRDDIEKGLYRDGEVLGTEDMLTSRFSVSRQTVRQAISILANEGLVIRRQGSGTYVNLNPVRQLKTHTVGVVTSYITDYIFPSIVRGIETALSSHKYNMRLAATYNSVEKERTVLKSYLDSPVDGLLVEGTKTALPNPNIDLYKLLAARNIPIVFINSVYPDIRDAVSVVTDDRAGGQIATEYLLERGHRRIAGIFKVDDRQGHERYAGFSEALLRAGAQLKDDYVTWFTTESKSTLFSAQAAESPFPGARECTALVCYNDEIALLALNSLRRAGLRVPEDLSVISFDNSQFAVLAMPQLTSLNHPREQLGKIAAEKLLDIIAGQSAQSVVLPFTVTERASVKACE